MKWIDLVRLMISSLRSAWSSGSSVSSFQVNLATFATCKKFKKKNLEIQIEVLFKERRGRIAGSIKFRRLRVVCSRSHSADCQSKISLESERA